jgi:hypothetical protein
LEISQELSGKWGIATGKSGCRNRDGGREGKRKGPAPEREEMGAGPGLGAPRGSVVALADEGFHVGLGVFEDSHDAVYLLGGGKELGNVFEGALHEGIVFGGAGEAHPPVLGGLAGQLGE